MDAVSSGAPWWVLLILAIPSLISAFAAWVAATRSKRVDDAVNHRHHPDEPRLFDVVKTIAARQHHTDLRLDEMQASLLAHVVWEEREKYPTIEQIIRAIDESKEHS